MAAHSLLQAEKEAAGVPAEVTSLYFLKNSLSYLVI